MDNKLAKKIDLLFVSRRDHYAEGFYDRKNNKTGYKTIKSDITTNIIQKHLNGETTIGVYALNKKNLVKWICFDFDGNENDNNAVNTEIARAHLLYTYLLNNNIPTIHEFSGNKGSHIWVFLENCSAKAARIFANQIKQKSRIHPSETFPKQDSTTYLGNLVKLPLGLHPKTQKRSYLLDEKQQKVETVFAINMLSNIKPIKLKEEILEKKQHEKTYENLERPNKKTSIIPCEAFNNIITNGADIGSRHDSLLTLTSFYYYNGWNKEKVLKIITSFNNNCIEIKDQKTLEDDFNHIWETFENGNRVKVGCKSEGIPSTILNRHCPYSDKQKCDWSIEPISEIELKFLDPSLHEGTKIITTGLIWKIKEFPRIKEKIFTCKECGTKTIKKPKYPDDNPVSPKKCSAFDCKGKSFNSKNKIEHGVLIVLSEPNKIPDVHTRKAKVWCPVNKINIGHENINKVLSNILSTFGSNIKVRGRFIIEHEMLKTKIKKTTYWIIATQIEKKDLDIEKITLNDDEKEKMKKYFSEWTDEKINNSFASHILGHTNIKRAILLNMYTPMYIVEKELGIGRMMIIGDPETAKSKTTSLLFDNLKELGVANITAEYMSTVGLGGSVKKEDDEWIIDWGILPLVDKKALCIDGFHAFSKYNLAKMRELIESGKVKIIKAAIGEQNARARIIAISNTNMSPISQNYPTKYDASFDIGIESDKAERDIFKSADRRRWYMIYVTSIDDVNTYQIDNNLVNYIKEPSDYSVPFELLKKHIAWSWSLKTKDFEKLNDITPKILKIIKNWKQKYTGIELSILGNKAVFIFVSYVIASSTMHFRINENNKICPNEDDVEFVKETFEQMFECLQLKEKMKIMKTHSVLVDKIIRLMDNKISEIIIAMGQNPTKNIESIADILKIKKDTIYKRLKIRDISTIRFQINNINIEYSYWDGYIHPLFKLEPLISNGHLSKLGHLVYLKIKQRKIIGLHALISEKTF